MFIWHYQFLSAYLQAKCTFYIDFILILRNVTRQRIEPAASLTQKCGRIYMGGKMSWTSELLAFRHP